MSSSKKETLKKLQKTRKRNIKIMQKAKYKKMKKLRANLKKGKEKQMKRPEWDEYSKSFESAGNNFKNHMHKHTITWVIALVIFLLFISAAMLFILRAFR